MFSRTLNACFSYRARVAVIECGLIVMLICVAANSVLQINGTNLVATLAKVAANF